MKNILMYTVLSVLCIYVCLCLCQRLYRIPYISGLKVQSKGSSQVHKASRSVIYVLIHS